MLWWQLKKSSRTIWWKKLRRLDAENYEVLFNLIDCIFYPSIFSFYTLVFATQCKHLLSNYWNMQFLSRLQNIWITILAPHSTQTAALLFSISVFLFNLFDIYPTPRIQLSVPIFDMHDTYMYPRYMHHTYIHPVFMHHAYICLRYMPHAYIIDICIIQSQADSKSYQLERKRLLVYRATLIVARAHILSRPRVMCSQVRML